ncbi:hypothetical protein [Planococcus beijingensis]|uniref:hypothetical protein n=1 Tax=Planococcus beijingensis TaxID=2782551 RepID=UPI00193B6582|nr:hypothetical protein [Planococcus beijingensis]
MNKMVEQKMSEMTEVFNSLPNCRIETDEAGRILIVSDNPVPWSDTESPHKIGSITPHKAALGLYIDFPHNYIEIDRLDDIIDPEFTLTYYEPGTKTSTAKSWWRFRSDQKFDSLHMVLRKTELELYDFKREEWVQLMEEITGVHK